MPPWNQIMTMRSLAATVAALFLSLSSAMPVARAASGPSIDMDVDQTLAHFHRQVGGSRELMDRAAGVLVFPSVVKAGIGIGGEYGEGALRIGGRTVSYFNT